MYGWVMKIGDIMDNIDLLVNVLNDMKIDIRDIKKDVESIKDKMMTKDECKENREDIEENIEESGGSNLSVKKIVAMTSLATAILSGILAIVKVFFFK